jgi:phage terminase large subunit
LSEVNVSVNQPFLDQFTEHGKARYFYNRGGRWSGKTYAVIQLIIGEALAHPGLNIVMARKTYASIKDSLFKDTLMIIESIGLNYGEHYEKRVSPLEIRFTNGSNIIFKGADSPEKSKGLSNIHRLLLDELNEFTQMDFEALDLSVRGSGHDHRTIMCHNPIPVFPGQPLWFQELFDPGDLEPGVPRLFDREGLGLVSSLVTTYQHNAFCPKPTRDRLEGYKHTNPDLYRLWALGQYAQIKGAIYKNWAVVQSIPDSADLLGYGLDFGFSGDPAACLAIYGTKKEIWIQGLFYKRDLTNRDIGKELDKSGVSEYDKIVADSAEPKSIEELFRLKFRGIRGVKKRANYKADIIRVLQGVTIHVVEGDIDLQREISTYSWAQDKEGKQLPKPQDGNDHYMDCLSMFWHDYKGANEMKAADVAISI